MPFYWLFSSKCTINQKKSDLQNTCILYFLQNLIFSFVKRMLFCWTNKIEFVFAILAYLPRKFTELEQCVRSPIFCPWKSMHQLDKTDLFLQRHNVCWVSSTRCQEQILAVTYSGMLPSRAINKFVNYIIFFQSVKQWAYKNLINTCSINQYFNGKNKCRPDVYRAFTVINFYCNFIGERWPVYNDELLNLQLLFDF
jgi:hypothetical protein